MRSKRIVMGAVVAAMVVLSSVQVPAVAGHGGRPGGGSGGRNAIAAWNEIALNTLIAPPGPAGGSPVPGLPGPAGGAPPAAQVHVAMVQGAVYDAVNAMQSKRYQPYLLTQRFPRGSQEAAVTTAAYLVLHNIVSNVPPQTISDPARAALLQYLDAQHVTWLGGIPDGPPKTKGISAGTAAAAAMVAARTDDGRFGPSQWVPNPAPGHWSPLTNPTTGQPILDPTPWVGGVKPFLLDSSSQFRTRGPNDLSSKKWAREFNEVKTLGAANSKVRTPEQTYIARWWQYTPTASWNAVARDLAQRNGLDGADDARLLAMANLSGADAAINCWNDKYYWDFWRPWNAIARAGEDGNHATKPDATWTALITAPYPSHPSGHLCLDGALTRVLQMFFGDSPDGGFQITSGSTLLLATDSRPRSFASFSGTLDEIVEARIWAGLHYRTADVQAKALGKKVAQYMKANYFKPTRHGH